jgi:glycerol-3-phosphate O-acyltransferase
MFFTTKINFKTTYISNKYTNINWNDLKLEDNAQEWIIILSLIIQLKTFNVQQFLDRFIVILHLLSSSYGQDFVRYIQENN